MLSFKDGKVIAYIDGGKYDSELLSVTDNNKDKSIGKGLQLKSGKILPILDNKERSVSYIAGPSGSGKTTYAVGIIKRYLEVNPKSKFFIFSRTNPKNDPAFKGINYTNILIDDSLVEYPIDITTDFTPGTIILFDDVNTVQDDKQKKAIFNLICDILEVARKLNISIVITNHLVIPNERKMARTILNEIQSMTIFPKSGSIQQINYALKTYFGLSKQQIEYIIGIDSRWVTINRNYPQNVLYESGAFIL